MYWLVFYKLQSQVFTLLPPHDSSIYTALKASIIVCWVCQIVRVRPSSPRFVVLHLGLAP